jgi:hypothetical protein
MARFNFAECLICRVSCRLSVKHIHAECHYSECSVECRYAESSYVECRYAECRGAANLGPLL